MDVPLPLHQRLMIRMHLLMCKLCTRYQRQLLFLREIIGLQAASSEDPESAIELPPGARKRIKDSIREELNGLE